MPPRFSSSVGVLKALSSPIRMQILDLLYDKGPLSYTEIMKSLRLSPDRDAGKFAYHLKMLIKAHLIEANSDNGAYVITDLGRVAVSMAHGIKEQVAKRRAMKVRTSRLTIENFDRNKIVDSLVKEAGVPLELACKIAKEAEERLSIFRTKYLTAPLIRELVNAILIEKGLEEYRHKLTRLGLPSYDVNKIMEQLGDKKLSVETVRAYAGNRVMSEYTLLNVLHRDAADAYLSGAIHIENLSDWPLTIDTITHDLRIYLRKGTNIIDTHGIGLSLPPPKNFKSALLTILSVIRLSSMEVLEEQLIEFFTVFLAPFVKNLSLNEIKEQIKLFIYDLNQTLCRGNVIPRVSLGIELMIPKFLENIEAVAPSGRLNESYGDYEEECRLLAEATLKAFTEFREKPVFNPQLIIKFRNKTIKSELSLLAHELAAKYGTPFFAVLRSDEATSYDSMGTRFSTEWVGDWELDTLRVGSMGRIILNIPRVFYEAKKDEGKLLGILRERIEMAIRTLMVKRKNLFKRIRQGLLPTLSEDVGGETYFRMENASCIIGFVGLNEAVKLFSGNGIYENATSLKLALDLIKRMKQIIQEEFTRIKHRILLGMSPSLKASKRLARLDIERFGRAHICVRGSRENPYYTYLTATPLEEEIPLMDRMRIEALFQDEISGGHLAIIPLTNSDLDAETLLKASKRISADSGVKFYAYNRDLTYCSKCKEVFYGLNIKCPRCGLTSAIRQYTRAPARYTLIDSQLKVDDPIKMWFKYDLKNF